ncbi:cilia- and flagella-associated protein 141 [Microcaecilia unicolor]|uniref:Uncharacterized protein C1orf189 homolog n=1 Tax=Microcaecilia unicolor TaxID=1415580 RepID=A0A6P7X0X2_9AMPH|nr:uncharacterized protein C1orf189 homolog [Microcaecilia unicolor]
MSLARKMLQEQKRYTKRTEEIRIGKAENKRFEKLLHEAQWKEDIKDVVYNQIQQKKDQQLKHELQMTNREMVMVRRAALQQLLSLDYQQHRHDLNCMGTTFYVQRL